MNDFEASLAALRSRYADTLSHHLESLAPLLSESMTGENRAESMSAAISLAHRLHGTTGTYGFKEISGWMGEIEDKLRAWSTGHKTGSAAEWRALDALLQQALDSIGSRDAESGSGSDQR